MMCGEMRVWDVLCDAALLIGHVQKDQASCAEHCKDQPQGAFVAGLGDLSQRDLFVDDLDLFVFLVIFLYILGNLGQRDLFVLQVDGGGAATAVQRRLFGLSGSVLGNFGSGVT